MVHINHSGVTQPLVPPPPVNQSATAGPSPLANKE